MDPHRRSSYERDRARANSGGPRRRVWAAVLAPDPLYCALCGGRIDKRLPRVSRPGRPAHPMSATVDHIREIVEGGDPLDPANCQPAHRRCNEAKEKARQAARLAARRAFDDEFIDLEPLPERPDRAPVVGLDP